MLIIKELDCALGVLSLNLKRKLTTFYPNSFVNLKNKLN